MPLMAPMAILQRQRREPACIIMNNGCKYALLCCPTWLPYHVCATQGRACMPPIHPAGNCCMHLSDDPELY